MESSEGLGPWPCLGSLTSPPGLCSCRPASASPHGAYGQWGTGSRSGRYPRPKVWNSVHSVKQAERMDSRGRGGKSFGMV